MLIDKRFRSSISDVRSYRGAEYDSDHFLIIAKFRLKLKNVQINKNRILKYNLEKLKDKGENQKYIEMFTEKLRTRQRDKLETRDKWNIQRNTITEVTRKLLGEVRNQAKKWYNNERRNAVLKRNEYRKSYLRIIQQNPKKYLRKNVGGVNKSYRKGKKSI